MYEKHERKTSTSYLHEKVSDIEDDKSVHTDVSLDLPILW